METDECKSVGIKDLVAGHPGIARGPWNGIGTLSVVETRATKRTKRARKFVSSGIGAVQWGIGIHYDFKRIIVDPNTPLNCTDSAGNEFPCEIGRAHV